jgi:hypothetical protein
MNAEQLKSVEAIKVRVAGVYSQPIMELDHLHLVAAASLAYCDVDDLLQIIADQQAVNDAARVYRAKIEALVSEAGGDREGIAYYNEWQMLCEALDKTGPG